MVVLLHGNRCSGRLVRDGGSRVNEGGCGASFLWEWWWCFAAAAATGASRITTASFLTGVPNAATRCSQKGLRPRTTPTRRTWRRRPKACRRRRRAAFTLAVAVGRRLARTPRQYRRRSARLGPGEERLGRLPAPSYATETPRGSSDVADGGRRARALPSQNSDPKSLILVLPASGNTFLGVLARRYQVVRASA